ncbi:hypothetical protein BAE42_15975 [Mesorhizobium loti]|nr:hypothetical protein BAE42_15975 [Mesorhizobium loti]OBQ62539.1 hypothetical protein A8146_15475 [Mesorhizobium loti]
MGRSLPEEGAPRHIGFVYGYDREPQRRILDQEASQSGYHLHHRRWGRIADWFHITVRIRVLRQFVQGLENQDEQTGQDLLELCAGSNGISGMLTSIGPVTESPTCNSTRKVSKQARRTSASS